MPDDARTTRPPTETQVLFQDLRCRVYSCVSEYKPHLQSWWETSSATIPVATPVAIASNNSKRRRRKQRRRRKEKSRSWKRLQKLWVKRLRRWLACGEVD